MIAGNFESGMAQMKSTSQATFDQIASMLLKRNCRLRIEGHTDNVPIHNSRFSSNWELSTARATEIVRLLIVRDGFNPTRLSAAGYAEYHPIVSNANAAGRGTNRRVDIVILGHDMLPPPTAEMVMPAQVPPPTQSQSSAAPESPAQIKTIKPSVAVGR
jgi:chemotaxis protein MotB